MNLAWLEDKAEVLRDEAGQAMGTPARQGLRFQTFMFRTVGTFEKLTQIV